MALTHFHNALSTLFILCLWSSFSEVNSILVIIVFFECYCFINVLKHPVTKILSNFNPKLYSFVIENIHQVFTFSFTETYSSLKGASASYKNISTSEGQSRQNLNKLTIHQLDSGIYILLFPTCFIIQSSKQR